MRPFVYAAAAVWASACAHGPAGAPCTGLATAGGAPALPADVPWFDHAATLVGTVSATGTGRALPGAELSLVPDAVPRPQPDGRGQVHTDSAGGFVLLAGAGRAIVSVHAAGYRRVDTVVTLEPERADTLRVALEPLPCQVGGR